MMIPRLDAPISVAGTRRALVRIFAAAGLDTPALDARILVGHALGAQDFRDSALYDADYRRRFRGGAS